MAVGSLCGVGLPHDNCVACRERLYKIVQEAYSGVSRKNPSRAFLDVICFVPERNVLNGSAPSPRAVDSDGNDTDEPIVFSEWSLTADKVRRRDFRLDEMLAGNVERGTPRSLFGADYSSTVDWGYDEEADSLISSPVREFPLTSIPEMVDVD